MARLRQYLFPAAVVIVLLLLGAVAIASHGLEEARDNVPGGVELPEVSGEGPDFHPEGNGDGEVGISQADFIDDERREAHGECVSRIAEETEGDPNQGEIVSKAATPWQEDETDDCWFFTDAFPPGSNGNDEIGIETGRPSGVGNGAEFGAERAREARAGAGGNNNGS